ncbi:MAG: hypothetical protein K2J50_00970 [Treponemataceae bacterium]|nr:hypothetical protein [Treponemataceae bacterium]
MRISVPAKKSPAGNPADTRAVAVVVGLLLVANAVHEPLALGNSDFHRLPSLADHILAPFYVAVIIYDSGFLGQRPKPCWDKVRASFGSKPKACTKTR